MDRSFLRKLYDSHNACPACPSPSEVAAFFTDLLGALFPEYRQSRFSSVELFSQHMDALQAELDRIVTFNPHKNKSGSDKVASAFFDALPKVYERLNGDVSAMYEGDPAAKSRNEVIQTYPGFYAIAAYRVAHQLHQLGVPGIPPGNHGTCPQ